MDLLPDIMGDFCYYSESQVKWLINLVTLTSLIIYLEFHCLNFIDICLSFIYICLLIQISHLTCLKVSRPEPNIRVEYVIAAHSLEQALKNMQGQIKLLQPYQP